MRRLGQESQSCWRRQRATYPGGDIQMAITDRLAIAGGTPVRAPPLLPGWPGGLLIGAEEKAAVLEVIESQSLFRHYGPRPLHRTAALERAFAESMGVKHGLAVTSGTGALITSLAASGIGPGDEVAVPTYTWIATVSAVVILGAVPLFVDIDESLNMDPAALESSLTPHTRAVIPVERLVDVDEQGDGAEDD